MKDIDRRYEVENIILIMADIVRENRYLRKENDRLRKIEEEYRNFVFETARASEQSSRNMLKAALVGITQGKSNKELASELVEYI